VRGRSCAPAFRIRCGSAGTDIRRSAWRRLVGSSSGRSPGRNWRLSLLSTHKHHPLLPCSTPRSAAIAGNG
jgi:hypothetical protein